MRFQRGYRDLIAWQKAMELARHVHAASKSLPRDEQLALSSQLRRAAVSVPSNIAEGSGRTGPREFRHHLSVAHGSLCELETQLFLASDYEYLTTEKLDELLRMSEEVGRVIRGLMKSLDGDSSDALSPATMFIAKQIGNFASLDSAKTPPA